MQEGGSSCSVVLGRRGGWVGAVVLAARQAGIWRECGHLGTWTRLVGGSGSPSFLALTAGSGCQVEYLYSLVYQALDFISGKK